MGSRFDSSDRGGSRASDGYGYRRASGSGTRSSDAAGGYRGVDDDISRYSRDSYVGGSSRASRNEQLANDEWYTHASRAEREMNDREARRREARQARSYRETPTRRSQTRRSIASQQASEADVPSAVAAGDEISPDRARRREEAAARLANRRAASRGESYGYDRDYEAQADPRAVDARSRYSRSGSTYTAAAEPKRNTKKIVLIVLGVILAVALGAGGAAFAYFSGIVGKMNEGFDKGAQQALVQTDMAKEPFYMLLMGTDKSEQREEDGDTDGIYRSDSMMLARIDPVNKKVTMVSIPRDTLVDLGGEYGYQKINAAYAFGGPELAIKAVSKLAGVGISHYAEIDFDGFSAIVDALGGVEVDVPVDIDDWEAGGSVSAGLHTLSGNEALILCRSRNTYSNSAAPDLMRAANQRLVLSAITHKLLASDVGTIAKTVSSVADYVTTDIKLNDIIGLAQIMQGLSAEDDIYTASFPTDSVYVANGRAYADATSGVLVGTVDPGVSDGYYLLPDQDEWTKMKARMEKGESPSEGNVVDEATGTVLATAGSDAADVGDKYCTISVRNATSTSGLASKTAETLKSAGFQNVSIGEVNASYTYPETLILYDKDSKQREAETIQKTIGQGKVMKNDGSYLFDTDFMVIIGSDWKTESSS